MTIKMKYPQVFEFYNALSIFVNTLFIPSTLKIGIILSDAISLIEMLLFVT